MSFNGNVLMFDASSQAEAADNKGIRRPLIYGF